MSDAPPTTGVELTPNAPTETVASLAADAERAGFDRVFVSAHYDNRDPFLALSRVAAATETIRLGPGVVNPYETHPVTLASRMATLAERSDGRALFGLGAGDASTLAALGIERERPLRRVLETARVARALWNGERVDHDGTFRAADAALGYDVSPPPIYVGAQGPDMLRMSAAHADGVLVNAAHPDDIAAATDRIDDGLADRPPERGDLDTVAFTSVSVARDADAARRAARAPVAFVTAGAPRAVLDRHDLDPERAATVGDALRAGAYDEAFAAVSPAMIDAFCVAGDPETVEARLRETLAHVDGVVAGSPLGPDRASAIDVLGDVFERVRAP
ncbi:5,10-methylenetetrahydromethanopterin reductase [Halarchaeum rubridurum]|uniref:5,10-methylenetetrahydromethanopterin reductase n=1 Tax=Halarchaeum rubridurum TaxID=489911 RepID=A0A830FLT1_9EURY|nr:5,10-methylenetetrahydromethanopterin reductase [Halarchaeum rubridurum]MBP1954753.1 5,10-methylenetetrahydromethanopterin reductase [Halarchaeum rubridurum]GGM59512.1 5,10-methylenetetrahydromethanopterin reductase [Halarchaeum rubridurum]